MIETKVVEGEAGRFCFSVEVDTSVDVVNYGADADGNRGATEEWIEWDIKWDTLELSFDDSDDGDKVTFCKLDDLNPVEKKQLKREIEFKIKWKLT